MNKAKNAFVKWLKKNKAENIKQWGTKGDTGSWDYYTDVDAFIGDRLYSACFTVWQGKERIDYSDEESRYSNLSIEEFLELIK